MKQLTKRMFKKTMNAEMDTLLGYEKHQRTDASSNFRNGKSKKQLQHNSI
ncbi:MAG: transposase [Spirochaetes bacterium]|nr:transposase [Spirochaetota bacterium]MBN2771681.1 transposase [Spirochaetota bacterium]